MTVAFPDPLHLYFPVYFSVHQSPSERGLLYKEGYVP